MYYILPLIAFIITILAQTFVTSSYKKYSKVPNEKLMTGAEAARRLLDKNGLNNVKVTEVNGFLSDHYDPREKVVRLSNTNYNGTSIASVSVAAHECGHAIQDKVSYTPMRIRAKLVPVVNFSTKFGYIVIMIGLIFGALKLAVIGLILLLSMLLFQLVTLPVEFDASRRGKIELDELHILNSSEQQDFVARHKSIDKIKVSLNEVPDIEKSYDIKVKGSDDVIEKLRYFELPEHEKFGKMGWGWYAVTDFSVQINDEKDPCAGIRLRKHNISLDKNILNPYFKEARGNKYFYGEIFVTNENIVPDSGRQGLAAGEEADALIKAIKDYFAILHLVYNKASRLKTRLKNLDELLGKIEGASDPKVRNILSDKLREQVREYEKFSSPDSHIEVNDVLDIYNKKYRSNLLSRIQDVLHPASNPGPATVEDNPEPGPTPAPKGGSQPATTIVQGPTPTISKPTSGSNPEPPRCRPTAPQPPTPPIPHPTTPPSATSSPAPRPQSELDEMLMTLQDKQQCTPDQIAILRKVFKTMMIVCPSASKKTLTMLMRAAIESIG